MSVFFNGRLIKSPSVESQVYDGELANTYPQSAGNVVAIIGTSMGGKPKTVLGFDNPVRARQELVSGELLDGIEATFSASPETGAPARVIGVRIEDAVQSSLVLQDGEANDVITLQSADYGAHTNNLRAAIASGTSKGKKVTIQNGTDYYVEDNIARDLFTIEYTGAEASATFDVTAGSLVLDAPDATPVATLALSDYATVRELCDAINAVADFEAVALRPTEAVDGKLDGFDAVDCKTAAATVTGDLQAIIDWINTGARSLVVATREAGALAVPANLSTTYFSGGSNGAAPDTDDWQEAFDALQEAEVRWVVPLSENPDVWAMADAHCQFMSGPGKSERRAFVGRGVISGTLATAIATAKTDAASINSDRTALVFPGRLVTDAAGELVADKAYMNACKIAGGFAALNPAETMTNKVISVQGLDPLLTNAYDVDELIDAGVCCIKSTKRGFVVAKAVSTWLSDDNFNRVEISVGAGYDFLSQSVREALDSFLGRKGSPITLQEAKSVTDSVLRNLSRPEPAGIGLLVGDEEHPPYRNITAEIEGDVLRVWFEASVAIPINYVLVGIHAKAYSGTTAVPVI